MATFFVYIIYSPTQDSFYVGYTSDPDTRLKQHNGDGFKRAHTNRAQDWQYYFMIQCKSESQAKKIEKHIKKNKSRKYLRNIKAHPNISDKLLETYPS